MKISHFDICWSEWKLKTRKFHGSWYIFIGPFYWVVREADK